ncbi:GTP-binding protein, partial [Streptomyces scabiei]|uniref:GTP-binding protein n=1 Tax=Streptomyces scabiei TaxID=1930 RepID=UPI0015C4EE29
MTQLSVAIVGGLHADARRAAVEALLAGVPGSVALHHDLSTAADGPDAKVVRTVRDATGVVSTGETPLVNDCACCALREDLVPELERLADAGLTRLAVVELWDSVEPKAMAEVVAASGLRLTSVITAVDPALLLPCLGDGDDLADRGLAAATTDQRTVADTFARQLEYAPVLAVLDSDEADEEDRALLAQLHPTARKVPIGDGASESAGGAGGAADAWSGWFTEGDAIGALEGVEGPERGAGQHRYAAPPRGATSHNEPALGSSRHAPRRPPALIAAAFAGFDVDAAAAAQHPACALLPTDADECGVTTLVWRRHRPFHPERLYAALEDLCCESSTARTGAYSSWRAKVSATVRWSVVAAARPRSARSSPSPRQGRRRAGSTAVITEVR